MNWIPPGTFVMGSPETELGRDMDEQSHAVTLTRALFVDVTETTQRAWVAVSGGPNPSYFQTETCVDGTCAANENANPDGPADRVDWYAAASFANAKSGLEGLSACYSVVGCDDPVDGWRDGQHSGCSGMNAVGPACDGYRLPTEAEWEYLARAGSATASYGGDLLGVDGCVLLSGLGGFAAETPLAELGWYGCNAGARPRRVGTLRPNAWGLFDLLGNMWEWTEDGCTSALVDATDPQFAPAPTCVVQRGGSWYGSGRFLRAAMRSGTLPTARFGNSGFRLVRTAP